MLLVIRKYFKLLQASYSIKFADYTNAKGKGFFFFTRADHRISEPIWGCLYTFPQHLGEHKGCPLCNLVINPWQLLYHHVIMCILLILDWPSFFLMADLKPSPLPPPQRKAYISLYITGSFLVVAAADISSKKTPSLPWIFRWSIKNKNSIEVWKPGKFIKCLFLCLFICFFPHTHNWHTLGHLIITGIH